MLYRVCSPSAEEYVYKDLSQEIEKNFRVKTGRLNSAIGGTSLGGYAALKIAMKYPESYSSVAVGSPIILLGDDPAQQILSSTFPAVRMFSRLFEPVFGRPFNQDHWLENSVEVLARTADLKDLSVFMSYGTADRYQNAFAMEKNIQTIHEILTEKGITSERTSSPLR